MSFNNDCHFHNIVAKVVLTCYALKTALNKHGWLFFSYWNLSFLASRQKSGRTVRGTIEHEQSVKNSAKQRTFGHATPLTFWSYSSSGTSDSRRWVIPCLCFHVRSTTCTVSLHIITKNPWCADYYPEATRRFRLVRLWDGWLLCIASLCTVLMMLSARWGVGMREGGGVHGGENWGREGLLLIFTAPQHFS